jgi:hypothetical protein
MCLRCLQVLKLLWDAGVQLALPLRPRAGATCKDAASASPFSLADVLQTLFQPHSTAACTCLRQLAQVAVWDICEQEQKTMHLAKRAACVATSDHPEQRGKEVYCNR